MVMIAVVVNPKDGRAYFVEVAGNTVFIEDRITRSVVGEGTFEYDRSETEIITGFPRVHTDHGVKQTDVGLGTVLYTGMCAAAAMDFQKKISLDVAIHGPGISSDSNRSTSASKWWNNAKNKYGLAIHIKSSWPRPYKHEADAYPFENALKNHLVAMTVVEDEIEAIDPIAVRAINLSDGKGEDDLILAARSKIDIRPNPYQKLPDGWERWRR